MHTGFKIPSLRLYDNHLIIFDRKYDFPKRSEKQLENEKNLTRGQYNGFLSKKTRSDVRKYLNTWIKSIETIRELKNLNQVKKIPYLTFVTLTLPAKQFHSDNEIKRQCLTPFIETLKRKHNVWNYYWVAEVQKNGNIHFHLLIDSYVHHEEIRKEWNNVLSKLDYIIRFCAINGHVNPNSTDIHKISNAVNASSYVLKYILKDEFIRPIEGRIHGCSDRVRNLQPYETELDSNAVDMIAEIKKNPNTKIIKDDNYQIICFDQKTVFGPNHTKVLKQAKSYYKDVAMDLYNNKEASIIEVFQAKAFAHYEKMQSLIEQLSIPYESPEVNLFHANDNF